MRFTIADGITYTAAEAAATVLAYRDGTRPLKPNRQFGDVFVEHRVPLYGYRTYDCVPASAGPGFTDLDLLVGAGLNARLNVESLTALRSFTNRAPITSTRPTGSSPTSFVWTAVSLGTNRRRALLVGISTRLGYRVWRHRA